MQAQTHPEIKAIFFDIDGTLLSFKTHQVPDSTREALRALKAKGIKIFISTGRSINSLDQLRSLDFDGYITFNGGYCVSKENEVIYSNPIPRQDIDALIDYTLAVEPLGIAFMSAKEIRINQDSQEIRAMYRSLHLIPPPLVDYTTLARDQILQVNLFIDPAKEARLMPAIMPNSLASRWTDLFADVNAKGQSKKVGIDVFLKHYGLDISQTMAFGDGGNDISMLQHVQIGVAMGNANENVKEIADYITSTVDDNGILNALQHYAIL